MSIEPMEHCKELLPDYLAGAVDPEARLTVERHLAGCAECRSTLEDVVQTFSYLPREMPGPGSAYFPSLLPRIRERLAGNSSRQWWKKPMAVRIALPLATALLIIGIVSNAPWGSDPRTQWRNSLQPLIQEMSQQELSELLDEIPGMSSTGSLDERLAQESLFERRLRDSHAVPPAVLQEAITEDSGIVPAEDLLAGLEEADWERVLQKLDERTVL